MTRKLSPNWTLAILTGLNLFNYLDRFVLSAVLPPLKAELHLNDSQAGWIPTTFMLGYFVTSPIFGYLGDRLARKWLIAVGIFVWSLGTVLTGFAGAFATLLAFRVLVGVGEASYATISPSLISDNFGNTRRNDALTIFYVAIPIGAALGTLFGGFIATRYSWHAAFIWSGAPGLLLALILLPFEEAPRGGVNGAENNTRSRPTLTDVFNLFRLPRYVVVVAGYAAYTFAMGAFATWGPSFFYRVHGMSLNRADTFFGLMAASTGLTGTFIGGFVASAWQKRSRAGYAWLMGLSATLSVPFAFAAFLVGNALASQICLAVAMFLLFLPTGPVNTMILETVPANLHASAMALSIFVIHLFGDLWSSEIVGELADQWNDLRKAVLILPAALLICAIFWVGLAARITRKP
jgi:MFS transporter, Spinster family, sphingosine-1-phosphate transporter